MESNRRNRGEGGEGRGGQYRVVIVREGEKVFFFILGQRQGMPRWADDPVFGAAKDDGRVGGTL